MRWGFNFPSFSLFFFISLLSFFSQSFYLNLFYLNFYFIFIFIFLTWLKEPPAWKIHEPFFSSFSRLLSCFPSCTFPCEEWRSLVPWSKDETPSPTCLVPQDQIPHGTRAASGHLRWNPWVGHSFRPFANLKRWVPQTRPSSHKKPLF